MENREKYNVSQLSFAYIFFNTGDKLEVLRDIYEGGNDCHPGGYVARKGDMVIIKSIASEQEQLSYPYLREWPFTVAHEWVTGDMAFRIGAHEIAHWIGYSPAKQAADRRRQEEIDYWGYAFDDLFVH